MTVSSVFVVLFFFAVLIAYIHGDRSARRDMRTRFSGRENLGWEPLCGLFCAGHVVDSEMIREILGHVATELSVEPFVLRPSDRFAEELKPPKGWEFDAGATTLLLDLAGLARKKGVTIDMASIVTLDDFVLAMSKVCGNEVAARGRRL